VTYARFFRLAWSMLVMMGWTFLIITMRAARLRRRWEHWKDGILGGSY